VNEGLTIPKALWSADFPLLC